MSSISVIIALYNEASNLQTLRTRLNSILDKVNMGAEIVLVDDHSTDDSPGILREWAAEDPRVTYIRFSRNSGSHAAYAAGLRCCRGDCAVILAADLQDPPESIPLLIAEWHKGYDLVWARRASHSRADDISSLTSRLANWIFEKSLPNWPKGGVDFFLADRKVVDAYKEIREKNTSFVAILLWMGFNQTTIEYEKHARLSGQPKWSLARKLKLFVDCIVSFSYMPIRLASCLGILVSFLGFLYAGWIFMYGLAGHPVAGWSSLMVVVLILGGMQLLVLGILGEYLWRTFDEARQRPLYLIEQITYGALNGESHTLSSQSTASVDAAFHALKIAPR